MSTVTGADAYDTPSTGGDGDGDDQEAAKIFAAEGSQGIWTPECWSKSPVQLIEEARSMNEAAFASAAAGATRHSNPPCPPSSMRSM
jgi:hypothetical protein